MKPTTTMTIELQQFPVPTHIVAVMPTHPRTKQDGFHPELSTKWVLRDVPEETLSNMCDIFRDGVFRAAGKIDPKKQPTTDRMRMILEIEEAHFRTSTDTGAQPSCMMLWNLVRKNSGLPDLTVSDLPVWGGNGNGYVIPPDSNLAINLD